MIRQTLDFPIAGMNSIPPPDYRGFIAQANHWTPSPVIPYVLARGCYWGKCSFCDIPIGYDFSAQLMAKKRGKKLLLSGTTGGTRRECAFEKSFSDLNEMARRYKTRWFAFGDEELDVETLERFAEPERRPQPALEFECYSRIEEKYAEDGSSFCSDLRESGCRFLQFGLESVSLQVLKENNKYSEAHEKEFAGEIFKATSEAGIMNHAFILVGLPGDSLLEASKMIPFLERTGRYLTTIKPVFHKVSKWSPIALRPERHGIVLDQEGSGDLDVNINLGEGSKIMSRHRAESFVRFLDLWIRKHHKINVATSQYIYAQRLFLGRDELEAFASEQDQPTTIDPHDDRYLRKVRSGLLEELKQAAYAEHSVLGNCETLVDPSRLRHQFGELYRRNKDIAACDFDSVLELVKQVAAAQTDPS